MEREGRWREKGDRVKRGWGGWERERVRERERQREREREEGEE